MSKPPSPINVNNGAASTGDGYSESLQLPVSGPITSAFGARTAPKAGASTYHKGIDIGVPTGTPVAAAADGTVTFAGTQNGYGNVITIQHDDNTETKYAHLSTIDVSKGQQVSGGEIIGLSGATGNVTGPHVHFEEIVNGKQVNPLSNSVAVNSNAKSTGAQAANAKLNAEQTTRDITLNYNQDDIIKTLLSGEHFKDNPANDYDNLTYHWRFFMTVDQEVVDGNTTLADGDLQKFYSKLNSYGQVTIAESGVTSYSIDEVTMDATVGTDFQTESTKFTAIEMKVTEPNGVSFLDALRNAALQLGVRNYQKTFYYLELVFKGYNADGTINLTPFDGKIPNGGHWIWTVKITDIDVNLTAGGGQYTLKMTPLTDSLLTGTYNLIPTTISPSGATVGAFMDDLCTKLNNVWAKIKGDPGIITYKTKWHPVKDLMTADEVKAMAVTPAEQDLNPEQGFDFKTGTNTAQIAQGFTISRTLDCLMRATELAQKYAADALKEQTESPSTYRQSILWRVEPEIHVPNYDPVYNEYYHNITLHIYGFRHHSAVLTPQDTLSNAAAQKAILADMANRNFLPKKYEYLFTGVNSEVIDLDLSFNLAWMAQLPTIASNTQEQAAQQARVDPKAKPAVSNPDATTARQQAQSQSTQTVAGAQSAKATTATQTNSDLAAAKKALEGARTDENVAAYNAAVAANNAAQADLLAQGKITDAKRAQLTKDRPASLPTTDYGRTFGEDLNKNAASYQLTDARKNEAFPVTVQVYTPTTSDTVGLPGQFHDGMSTYGAVLNQVYGPMAEQFFTQQLTIKGDPFWIGAGSFEEAIFRSTDVFNGDHPNYPEGCNCYLFRMKYPTGLDDGGNIILKNQETVTAIYQVNKVQHRFIDGKFTQVLSATRVTIIDLYNALYKSLYPQNPTTTTPTTGSN